MVLVRSPSKIGIYHVGIKLDPIKCMMPRRLSNLLLLLIHFSSCKLWRVLSMLGSTGQAVVICIAASTSNSPLWEVTVRHDGLVTMS